MKGSHPPGVEFELSQAFISGDISRFSFPPPPRTWRTGQPHSAPESMLRAAFAAATGGGAAGVPGAGAVGGGVVVGGGGAGPGCVATLATPVVPGVVPCPGDASIGFTAYAAVPAPQPVYAYNSGAQGGGGAQQLPPAPSSEYYGGGNYVGGQQKQFSFVTDTTGTAAAAPTFCIPQQAQRAHSGCASEAGVEILQILGGGAPATHTTHTAMFAASLSPPSRSFLTNPITRDHRFGNAPILNNIVTATGSGPAVPDSMAFSPPQ